MQEKNVAVLFTGQIRDTVLFERSLAELSAQPCVKQLIFSTWIDDALEHADYLEGLEQRFGLRVVTTVDPRLACDRFNGFRQSMTLRRGLEAATERHVLKTRTDCHIDAAAVTHLARKDCRITDPQALQLRVFQEKVSVLASSMLAPFYIDDKLLFGHRDDLLKMCSLDYGEYRFPSSGKYAHYLRFYPPFRQQFPQFIHFVQHEIFATIVSEELRAHIFPLLLERREYALLMAVYYRLFSTFFCLDWGGHGCTFKGTPMVCHDGNTDFALNADQSNCSNAFFARAAQGDFDNAELRRLMGGAAESLRFVGDLRDAASGVDYARFFADVRREAKGLFNYQGHIDEARKLMRDPATLRDAFAKLTVLLPCDPGNQDVLYLVAVCYHSGGDLARATHYLEQCLDSGASYRSAAGRLLADIRREQAAGA